MKTLRFNSLTTSDPTIIGCNLITNLIEDLQITTNIIEINNDLFLAKDIEVFFDMVKSKTSIELLTKTYIFEYDRTQDENNKIHLLVAIRIANYLGCDDIKPTFIDIYHYLVSKFKLNSVLQFICHRELNIQDCYIVDQLTANDYFKLLEIGYVKKDILSSVNPKELLPLDVDDKFKEKIAEFKDIIDIVNEIGNCFIAGGFLAHAMSYMIKGCENEDCYFDIDIFCLNMIDNLEYESNSNESMVATKLVKRFLENFDCKSFTYSAVTTIFIRNSPIQIQVISCIETDMKKVLNSFDMECCKIAYIGGTLLATCKFHRFMDNGWNFVETGRLKHFRIHKYKNKGFNITINSTEIIGGEDDIEKSKNKWYCWTNESDERLLYLIRIIFGKQYVKTTFPIPRAVIEWRETYGFHNGKHNRRITHPTPFPSYEFKNVKIKLYQDIARDKSILHILESDYLNITKLFPYILKQYSDYVTEIKDLLNLRLGINNASYIVSRSKIFLVPESIKSTKVWEIMLDGELHVCDIKIYPTANVDYGGRVKVNMVYEKIELIR
jgi:hypothetical protein